LDKEFITAEIMKCVVKEGELRFKIGDRVECNMGTSVKTLWCLGEVTKFWESTDPYLVKLDRGDCALPPADEDKFIRLPTKGKK